MPNLSGILVPGTDLNHCDMEFVDLRNSNLSQVNFFAGKLSGTNFSGANLSDSKLIGIAALFVNFSSATNLQNADVSYALLLGTKYQGELLTDEILTHKGALNVDKAITSIAKLVHLLEQQQIHQRQAEFFKEQINNVYGMINSYIIRKQRNLFLKPEWAILAPLGTSENLQIMRDAYLIIDCYLKRPVSETEEQHPFQPQ